MEAKKIGHGVNARLWQTVLFAASKTPFWHSKQHFRGLLQATKTSWLPVCKTEMGGVVRQCLNALFWVAGGAFLQQRNTPGTQMCQQLTMQIAAKNPTTPIIIWSACFQKRFLSSHFFFSKTGGSQKCFWIIQIQG